MPWRSEVLQTLLLDAMSSLHQAVEALAEQRHESLDDLRQAFVIGGALVDMAENLHHMLNTGLRIGQVAQGPRRGLDRFKS